MDNNSPDSHIVSASAPIGSTPQLRFGKIEELGSRVGAAVAKSNALLPSGEFISPRFDANVYTNAIPQKVSTIGDAPVKIIDGHPVFIKDVVCGEEAFVVEVEEDAVAIGEQGVGDHPLVGGRTTTDYDTRLGSLQCGALQLRQRTHLRDVDAVQ